MNSYKNEKILREIAKEYVKKTGEQYDRESMELNCTKQHMPSIPITIRNKSRRWIPWVSAACACITIIFVLLSTVVFTRFLNNDYQPDVSSSPSAAVTPSDKKPYISLSDSRFEIDKITEDQGHVIYTINDRYGDDAVVHLMPVKDFDSDGMQVSNSKYYKNRAEYKILAAKKGEWMICMSCVYEMETLIALCEDIKLFL